LETPSNNGFTATIIQHKVYGEKGSHKKPAATAITRSHYMTFTSLSI